MIQHDRFLKDVTANKKALTVVGDDYVLYGSFYNMKDKKVYITSYSYETDCNGCEGGGLFLTNIDDKNETYYFPADWIKQIDEEHYIIHSI